MITRSFTVAVSVEKAFAAWTSRVDLWWPSNHRPSGAGGVVQIEPIAGGRFFNRGDDGKEVELGVVTAWEPPNRFGYRFFLGSSAAQPSEVVIDFQTEGGGTRVDIEHRPGAVPAELWNRTNGGYERAWNHLIEVFVPFTESQS